MKQTLFFLFLLFIYSADQLAAQELNAQVVVQTPKLRSVDPKIFKTLEKDLTELLNTTKWTSDEFTPEERIECSFLISITEEITPQRFRAQASIQSSRPVYNSSYKTLIFNHQDKGWEFEYQEFEPLQYNENSYLSEITSLMGYYVNIILGLDYDTFAPQGGRDFFERAQNIVNLAQNSPKATSSGWKPDNNRRNRYWLLENLQSNKFRNFRKAYYDYHRLGLDKMHSNLEMGRSTIVNALSMIDRVNRQTPNTMGVDMFINAKADELIKIFANEAVPPGDKARAYSSLTKLDPGNVAKYREISNIQAGRGSSNQNGRYGNNIPPNFGKTNGKNNNKPNFNRPKTNTSKNGRIGG